MCPAGADIFISKIILYCLILCKGILGIVLVTAIGWYITKTLV